jgi:hypothetical protein
MTQSGTMSGTDTSRYDGTDYVCSTCGCEIMVKYVCTCGTPMDLEHGKASS